MGRPTKFDDVIGQYPTGHARAGQPITVEHRIVDMLTAGNYIETAAQAAGIDKVTLHEWLRTGAHAFTKISKGALVSDLTEKERRCMVFSHSVHEAQAEAEARDVATLDQLAGGGRKIETVTVKVDGDTTTTTTRTEVTEPNPAVLMWRLERRFPDRWGRRRLEISGPDGEPIPIEARAKALADALREHQGGGSGADSTVTEPDDGSMDDDTGSDDDGV